MSPAHKTRYTNRVAAARKVKARGGAERPAAAERAGEGAGALVWLPVAAGDSEGVDGDGDGVGVGDCPKSGAPDEGAGTGDALGAPAGTETWHLLTGGVLTLHAAGSCRALVMLSARPKSWPPWKSWQRQATSPRTTSLSPEQQDGSGAAAVLPSCT